MEDFDFDSLINGAKTVYSCRRSIAIEIKSDGSLIIRAPQFISQKRIDRFIAQKRGWIIKTVQKVNDRQMVEQTIVPLTDNERAKLKAAAMEYFPQTVEYYAKLAGIKYGKLSYRFQKTRWGSCNRKGDISFNCVLMLAPGRVRESVVVHELCHIKHFNHSSSFYREITKLMPDYKEVNDWFKQNGQSLLAKIK